MISSFNGLILKNTDQGGESQRRATTEGGSCAYQLLGSVLAGIYDPQGDPSPLDKRSSLGFQEVQELSQGRSANRDHAWLPTQVYQVLKLASSQDSAACESDLNSVQPIPKPTPGWHPLTAPRAKLATCGQLTQDSGQHPTSGLHPWDGRLQVRVWRERDFGSGSEF